MRTETRTINIYKFEELKKEIQEKLIQNEKEYQLEAFCESFLLEEMEEKARELLKKYFKNNATFRNVFYSLSYCQGDGAMIEFELNYYNKPVTIKQYGNYYHARSFSINSYELTDKQEKQLQEKIIKINKKLEDFGYSCIDYYCNMPKSEVVQFLDEYEYTSDGTIYSK